MNSPPSADAASEKWTSDSSLNCIISRFVQGLKQVLGDNLVGIYLQGSLAQGEFDNASDVDFLVVIHEDLRPTEIGAINDLHAQMFASANPWAQHLEGSYAPAAPLRALSGRQNDPVGEDRPRDWRDPEAWRTAPYGYPFWFIGNGSQKIVRSEHDNSQVMRWLTREWGVRLVGPPPKTLIDPVTPVQLRSEVSEMLSAVAADLRAGGDWLKTLSGQSSATLLFARALETLETGRVGSKRSAADYAQANLAPRWSKLVREAYRARRSFARASARSGAQPNEPTDPRALKETLAFGEWAARRASKWR